MGGFASRKLPGTTPGIRVCSLGFHSSRIGPSAVEHCTTSISHHPHTPVACCPHAADHCQGESDARCQCVCARPPAPNIPIHPIISRDEVVEALMGFPRQYIRKLQHIKRPPNKRNVWPVANIDSECNQTVKTWRIIRQTPVRSHATSDGRRHVRLQNT